MDHSKRTRAKIHSKSKSRPKTIHIDVYCSTSSPSEGDSSDQMSDGSDGSILTERRRSSRALLSLGSKKNNKKSDFLLCARDDEKKSKGTMRAGSFVYRAKDRLVSPTVPAFMTDHPLSLCSSSPPLERPTSSPPMVSIRSGLSHDYSYDAIALPYQSKPNTLPLSPLYTYGYPPRNFPGTPPGKVGVQTHRRTGSGERGVALPAHSPTLDYLDPFFKQNVDVSSIYDEFASLKINQDREEGDDLELPWRSPKLERRRYLAKSQEDREKVMENLDNQRTYRDSTRSSEETPSTIQSSSIRTPTEVSELAKMTMFKDFSEEELQVISKSLSKRESERSQSSENSRPISRHSSFAFPRSGSFHDNADEFARLQSDTHLSSDSTQFIEPCNITDTVNKKKEVSKLKTDGSHLFRNSYENSKLVKFMNEPCDKSKDQPTKTIIKQQPFDDNFESKKSPKYVRPINVGLFRRINRFPFNVLPHPSSRSSGAYSQLRVNDQRFIRPHVFGEALVRANRRQGIHFGPPRNPQCSCMNCLSHLHPDQNNLSGCRLKSQSLSDLYPATVSPEHSPE